MKRFLWLGLIVLLAAVLRFYQLGTIAPSLTWDEAAWGYNAYSLGIDGRDEYGKFMPVDYFESFGDYKPPVYAYLDILPVKVFGLTEFAVRFPSALFGTLTVLVTYFLVQRIFSVHESKKTKIRDYTEWIALVSAGLLAISPWHILLSRGAFEANVATFLLATGVWLFLEAVQRKKYLLILSAVSFVLAFYTFNSARIVGPILLVGLAIGFWRQLLQMKKAVVLSAVIGIALLLPILPFLLSPQSKVRFQEVNIFSDLTVLERSNQEIVNDGNAPLSKIIHNRRLAYGTEYLDHYFDNLSFDFLFIHGDDNPKFSVNSMGQLYLFELPFLIAGILFLFRKRTGAWWIVPFWLLAAIVPAAAARETPHALRIEGALPMFQILVAYGFVSIFRLLPRLRLLAMTIVALVALCNVVYFVEDYFTHYATQYSKEWQYGYKEALAYMQQEEGKYSKIYFTGELGRPYIYTLFYTKYDPASFRANATIEHEGLGFTNVHQFGKYYFKKELLVKTGEKNVLYFAIPSEVPAKAQVHKKFYSLDGKEALVAYTL